MEQFKKLWPYIKPQKNTYLLVFFFGVLMSLCNTLTAALVKPLFDEVFTNKNSELKLSLSAAIVGIYFVHGFARYYHSTLVKMAVEYICAGLREDLQKKFLKLNLTYHSANPPGVLLSKAFNDVSNVQYGLWKLADLIRDPIAAVFLLAYVIYLDWKLTLVVLIAAPIIAFVLKKIARSARKHSYLQQTALEDVTTVFKESVDGVRVIQSYNLEKFSENKLIQSIKNFLVSRKKIISREELAGPITEFIGAITFACVLFYKATLVIDGAGTTGDFMSYLTALAFLQKPIKNLQDSYVRFQGMLVGTDRIFQVLNDTAVVPLSHNPKVFPKNFSKIQFKDISFEYAKNSATIKGLSLQINRGEVVAFVGESGSGKSTLVNLLERFYDPHNGSILLDDVPTTEIDLKDLRKNIALVTQDVFLFNDTLEMNIRAGNLDQEIMPVDKAAELANAKDFIEKTPDKYLTPAGDRGARFSGGEKQRISIARAIYKNAPILILDEATSALDSQSEQEVQKGLEKLIQGRTVFVIAHRLSTIINADRIVVMKNGQIVEVGTHDELISKNGAYYNFYQLQSIN